MADPGRAPPKSAEIEIRCGTAEDAEQVAAIYAHSCLHTTATYDVEPWPVEAVRAKLQKLLDARFPLLVACDAAVPSTVLGYAYAGPFREKRAYDCTVEDTVYVHPDHFGKGIGSALLRELLAVCDRDGRWHQMLAVIGADNEASVHIHRKAGFVDVGRMPHVGRKFGTWLSVSIRQRALGKGSDAPPAHEPL